MSYELNEDQIKGREQAIKFLGEYISYDVDAIEREGELTDRHIQALKDSGIWKLLLDNSTDWVTKVTVLTEIAKESPSIAAVLMDVIVSSSIVSTDLEEEFYATAFVEEEAGSDLSMIQTVAEINDKNTWVITGEKWFVANAGLANKFLVLVKNHEGYYSVFQVPKMADGVIVEEQKKMGLEGLKLFKVMFNNVSVPSSSLVIPVIEDLSDLHLAYSLSKISIASLAVGISEAALTVSLERAQTRQQFRKPIGDFQAIQFKIAEMTVGINGAKMLIYNTAQKLDRNEDVQTEASMAKMYSSEVANKVVNHAIQIHGAHGILNDSLVSVLYRSQRMTEIYGQTSEVQRLIISDYVINSIGTEKREVNHEL